MSKLRLPLLLLFAFLYLGLHLAEAAPGDTTADAVLGQANFNNNSVNGGGSANAASLYWPSGMAVDNKTGRLYISDHGNNRVLSWPDAESFANGAPADIVLGQTNFTNTAPNQGGGQPDSNTLSGPTGIAIDQRTGRLYVSDFFNHRVLSYPAPITTGMAADHVYGQFFFTTNIPNPGGVTAATLYSPWGLAFDNDTGHLYVADFGNSRVLKYGADFDPDAISVFGQPNFTSGIPNNGGVTAHSLSSPTGIAFEPDTRSLAIADSSNNRVLIYDLNVSVTDAQYVLGQNGSFNTYTINNGGLSAKSLYTPAGVAFDSSRNLYVADRFNNRVLYFQLNLPATADDTADSVFGQPNFTSGTANNGGVSASSLNSPQMTAVTPDQNLLVADRSNNRVLRYDRPQPYGQPRIDDVRPETVAIGSPSFKLLVRGSGFNSLSTVTWNGQSLATTLLDTTHLEAAVPAANVAGSFNASIKVTNPAPGGGTSAGQEWVTGYTAVSDDATADQVLGQSDFDNADWTITAEIGLGPRLMEYPSGTAIDPVSGRLYVSATGESRILSWPSASAFANSAPADMVIGQPNFYSNLRDNGGVNILSLDNPYEIATDHDGNLYVADGYNSRVLVYLDPANNDVAADFVFGQPGFADSTPNNGGISADTLDSPYGVLVGPDGTLYVADMSNHRILIYFDPLTTDRTADVVLGQPNFTSNGQNQGGGNPSASSLAYPQGMALDGDGRLYVADYFNSRVLVYAPPFTNGKAASSVFGQPNFTSATPNNGGLSASSLYYPPDVAIDAAGNVYISDYENNRVLAYDQPVSQNDYTADRVFGQPNFTTNNSGLTNAKMDGPSALALTSTGDLLVADYRNDRLLAFHQTSQAGYTTFLPFVKR